MTLLNILMTSGIFPPDIGGPASYVPKMAKALTKRGHRVTVICLSDHLQHNDSEIYSFRIVRIRRGGLKPVRILKTIYNIWRHARNADVVFANTLPMETALGGRLAGKPVVHKIVGDYAWETARNRGWFEGTIDAYQMANKSFLLKCLDAYIKTPLMWAAHLFAPSVYLAHIVRGWRPYKRVSVIYNAIQLPKMPSDRTVTEETVQIITICRLVSWKGVDDILQEMNQFPQAVLTIVGDGPERSCLEQISRNLNIESRVHFMGHLDNEAAMHLLQKADIFILNSTYEGLPHVVLEAMFYKKTVICNDVGGCGEVVKHLETGFLMQKGVEGRELRDALSVCVSDEALRRRLAERGQEFVQAHFRFEKMVDDTETLLRQLTQHAGL